MKDAWIPNTLSMFNLFTGFLAIINISAGNFYQAGWLIVLSLIWDSLDGNLARFLKNSSAFGRELDSLADVVSFVVAPSFLAFSILSQNTHLWIFLAVFSYLAAGASRLAQFNVSPPVRNYFRGLPTPAAAVVVTMTLLAFKKSGWEDIALMRFFVIAIMMGLSYLMVSQILYPKISSVPFDKWRPLFYIGMVVFIIVRVFLNLEMAISSLFLLFVIITPVFPPSFPRTIDGVATRTLR